MNLKGCLKSLCETEALQEKDPEKLKALCIKTIEDSTCTHPDKFKMCVTLRGMTTTIQIQKYIFNAFLRFNGLGVR